MASAPAILRLIGHFANMPVIISPEFSHLVFSAVSRPGKEDEPVTETAGQTPSAAVDTHSLLPTPPEERVEVRLHNIELPGGFLTYRTATGLLPVADDDGNLKASFFYTAYFSDGPNETHGLQAEPKGGARTERPITFAFNGGPGSSSVWLHLGSLGPKRVTAAKGTALASPPYSAQDNPATILNFTDIVFVDPVSTGYSRGAKGSDLTDFHSLKGDVEWMGRFINLFVTRHGRWGSPKFLLGESYGTTRAAGLASHLCDRYGMFLNGVVLISAVLDFITLEFDRVNDLPYPLILPTYAAIARFHGLACGNLSLEETLEAARQFAMGPYSSALMKGSSLTDGERLSVASKMAELTGLSVDFIQDCRLRVTQMRFCKELQRKRGLITGRLDGRFSGHDADDAGEKPEYDPSYLAILGPFTGALMKYLKSDLGFESDCIYEILTSKVRPWKWDDEGNSFVSVSGDLRSAMARNPHMRVFLGCGFYDLATPYSAALYSFEHMGLPGSDAGKVTTAYYEAGHMMYIHEPCQEKLCSDLEAFYRAATRE